MDEEIVPPARHSRASEALAVANDSHRNALDHEGLGAQVDFDRLEVGILRFELYDMAAAPPALDRDFIGEPRDHDLAGARFLGAMHGEQIAFEDAGVAHRQAAHAQKVVGAWREKIGVDLEALLDVLFG